MMRLKLLLARDRRATAYAAAFGALLVMLISLPLSAALNIWIDEAFTLHSTGAGLAYAWHEVLVFEDQPPLYFLLEAAWRTLNEGSIAFARFPSTVFAAAAVGVIVAATQRIVPRLPPLVVALMTAVNPIVIWAATEMRVYALVLLIGAVLLWTFYVGYLVEERSRRAQICHALTAVAALYTQYYIGFFLAAQGLTLLFMRRKALRPYIAAMAVVAVAFVPFVRTALNQVHDSVGFVSRPRAVHVVHEIVNDVFVYVLPHDIAWHGVLKLAGFALAAALVVAVPAFGRPVIGRREDRAVMVALGACLAIFTLVFCVAGMPPFLQRHIIVVAPSALLAGYLLVASVTRRQALVSGAALSIFAAFTVTTFWTQYHPPLMKPGDWARVAATLAADPEAPIAVFPAEVAVPLGTYLHAPIISIPKPMEFTSKYVATMTLTSTGEVERALDPVRAHSGRLWLVTASECGPVQPELYDYHCGYLADYLTRRYRLLRTVTFHGAFAQLYTRITDASSRSSARQDAN